MNSLLYSFIFLLTSFPAAQGIPWVGPTHTPDVASVYPEWAPRQTDGPTVPPVFEDLKRDLMVFPNTCGWLDGNPNSPWKAALAATCLWYSDLKVVNGFTTCVDYGQTACDGACPQAHTCNVLSPYCGSVYFPSGYRGYGNCNPTQGATYNIELTYTGLSEPVDLPIFTGASGISTGTQYPPGESAAATSVLDSAAATSVLDATATIHKSELGGTSTTPVTSSLANSSHSSTPIGAIVGGAVGGLALICVTVIAIIWIVRWKRQGPGQTAPPGPTFQLPPEGNEKTGAYQLHTRELGQPGQPENVPDMGPTSPRPELGNPQPPLYGVQSQYPVQPFRAELDA